MKKSDNIFVDNFQWKQQKNKQKKNMSTISSINWHINNAD
jgi:hypothetical protein